MGVFYNPPQPMPISQIGYSSGPIGQGGAGVSQAVIEGNRRRDALRKEEEAKHKERWIKTAIEEYDGKNLDDTVYKISEADPAFAKDWEKRELENLKAKSDYRFTKAQTDAEMTRLAIQMHNAGDRAGGLEAAKQVDPSIMEIGDTKNPNIKKISYRDPETGKVTSQILDVKRIQLAAIDSLNQARLEQDMNKFYAKLSASQKDKTIPQMKADAVRKTRLAQEYLIKADGDEKKALELAKAAGADIEFTQDERVLALQALRGDLMTAAAKGLNQNPEMLEVFKKLKDPNENPTEFIARLSGKQLEELETVMGRAFFMPHKESKKIRPKETGEIRTEVKVSGGTKKGPLSATEYAVEGGNVLVMDDDGNKYVVPNTTKGLEAAKKAGYRPATKEEADALEAEEKARELKK